VESWLKGRLRGPIEQHRSIVYSEIPESAGRIPAAISYYRMDKGEYRSYLEVLLKGMGDKRVDLRSIFPAKDYGYGEGNCKANDWVPGCDLGTGRAEDMKGIGVGPRVILVFKSHLRSRFDTSEIDLTPPPEAEAIDSQRYSH
jgi:hypothetical protein